MRTVSVDGAERFKMPVFENLHIICSSAVRHQLRGLAGIESWASL